MQLVNAKVGKGMIKYFSAKEKKIILFSFFAEDEVL
jgi:hypothetical protein